MNDLIWLGPYVQTRRRELGLTQAVLARWAGLSRATVNALESGALGDLSVGRLGRVLQLLGLRLGLQGAGGAALARDTKQAINKRHKAALQAAAQTVSVSYAQVMPPAALLSALTSGEMAAPYRAHLATLLDEAPLPMVVAAVGASAKLAELPAALVWRHVGSWAREMKSVRAEWRDL